MKVDLKFCVVVNVWLSVRTMLPYVISHRQLADSPDQKSWHTLAHRLHSVSVKDEHTEWWREARRSSKTNTKRKIRINEMNKTYNIFQTHFMWCVFLISSALLLAIIYTLWHHKLNACPCTLLSWDAVHRARYHCATPFSTTMPNFGLQNISFICSCFMFENCRQVSARIPRECRMCESFCVCVE